MVETWLKEWQNEIECAAPHQPLPSGIIPHKLKVFWLRIICVKTNDGLKHNFEYHVPWKWRQQSPLNCLLHKNAKAHVFFGGTYHGEINCQGIKKIDGNFSDHLDKITCTIDHHKVSTVPNGKYWNWFLPICCAGSWIQIKPQHKYP